MVETLSSQFLLFHTNNANFFNGYYILNYVATIIIFVKYRRLTFKHAASYAGTYGYDIHWANACIEYVYVTGIVTSWLKPGIVKLNYCNNHYKYIYNKKSCEQGLITKKYIAMHANCFLNGFLL